MKPSSESAGRRRAPREGVKIRILDLAEADLLRGFRFYEKQAEGIGAYFLQTLHSDIESLRLYAGMHQKIFGYFRLLSRRFPYAIYYQIRSREIWIWRVLDCRADPRPIAGP
jgi:plasmid stabilization system protein ParE